MKSTIFTHNWNNVFSNGYIPTIRLKSRKYERGEVHRIILRDKQGNIIRKGQCRIVSVRSFLLDDLPDYLAYMVTGLPAAKAKELYRKFYKKKGIDFSVQPVCLIIYENKTMPAMDKKKERQMKFTY